MTVDPLRDLWVDGSKGHKLLGLWDPIVPAQMEQFYLRLLDLLEFYVSFHLMKEL